MCSIPNTTIILLSIVRTDIDIFRLFVFSYFLFSLKVYWASILFSFMQYWANNAPEKTSFFSTIACCCFRRIDFLQDWPLRIYWNSLTSFAQVCLLCLCALLVPYSSKFDKWSLFYLIHLGRLHYYPPSNPTILLLVWEK